MSLPTADRVREPKGAPRRWPSLFVRLVAPLGTASVAAGAVWLHFASLDVVTEAQGRIVPSVQVQPVAASDGGVLREVLVADGDHVTEGQVLARLDDAGVEAEMDAQRARRLVLAADVARLEAEATGGAFHLPADVAAHAVDAGVREKALFRIRRAQLDSDIQILGRQLIQRQSEQAVLQERLQTTERSLKLLDQELAMGRELAGQGLKSKVEMLRLERQVNDAEGDAEATRSQLTAAAAAVDEAQRRIEERRQAFAEQALQDLGKTRADIAAADATLARLASRAVSYEVRAPHDGVVRNIDISKAGRLVRPGATLMALASDDGSVFVEGKVSPADLGSLRPGQTASVRIDGAGHVWGSLPATLEQVSLAEHDGRPTFLVRLRTAASLSGDGQSLPIEPGTVARVDILTGRRSLLDYVVAQVKQARLQVAMDR